MKAPAATFRTALAAGALMSVLMCGIDWATRDGADGLTESNPIVIGFLALLFLVSTLLYVIGLRNIVPEALKTRIAFLYLPTDRRGLELLSDTMARMFVWFVAASSVMAIYGWFRE